jgi:hypothetical protein
MRRRQDLTLGELALLVGRHIETLRRLARMRELPGVYKLGGRWAISREAADALRRVPRPEREGEGRAGQ